MGYHFINYSRRLPTNKNMLKVPARTIVKYITFFLFHLGKKKSLFEKYCFNLYTTVCYLELMFGLFFSQTNDVTANYSKLFKFLYKFFIFTHNWGGGGGGGEWENRIFNIIQKRIPVILDVNYAGMRWMLKQPINE